MDSFMKTSKNPPDHALITERETQNYSPDDPFDQYFFESPTHLDNGLLQNRSAHRWFDLIGWGCRNDLYTHQQALEGKSGPRVRIGGQELLMISSYDYLGLIGHPEIEEAAIQAVKKYGTSTGGVRLLTGTIDLHRKLESELADFKGTEASIAFGSGYLTNLGIISSLLGPRDLVIADSKIHRSIVDACRLARVPTHSFAHNDLSSLDHQLRKRPSRGKTMIVVEGIYSMDGDLCPLPEIIELKKKFGAYLMVDEAHSFGVLGPTGRGINEHFAVRSDDVDIWMASLSKAIPSNGGFIGASRDLIIFLQHGAAPFMFSAALNPSAVAAVGEALRILRREPKRLTRLNYNADFLRSGLIDLGYDTGKSASPIIPVIVGSEVLAIKVSRELFRIGIVSPPVLYPAVPQGSARLRLCATAGQDMSFLNEILSGFDTIRRKFEFDAYGACS
jgi:8-amino-7-oxononanoate synthase